MRKRRIFRWSHGFFVRQHHITAPSWRSFSKDSGFLRIIKGFANKRLFIPLKFVMSKMSNSVDRADDWDAREQLEVEDEDFKPLSHDEAQRLAMANPPMSPWTVIRWQVVVGILVAGVAFALTGRQSAAWSALYGALAVVVPAALFARGLSRQRSAVNAGAALAGFFVWELVKIALTVAMLFAAPRLILQLSWLALLAGFVVTMKVYWVVLWARLGRKS